MNYQLFVRQMACFTLFLLLIACDSCSPALTADAIATNVAEVETVSTRATRVANTFIAESPKVAPTTTATPSTCSAKDGTWHAYANTFTVSNCTISEYVQRISVQLPGGQPFDIFTQFDGEIAITANQFSAQQTAGNGIVSIDGRFTSPTFAKGTWKATSGARLGSITLNEDVTKEWTASRDTPAVETTTSLVVVIGLIALGFLSAVIVFYSVSFASGLKHFAVQRQLLLTNSPTLYLQVQPTEAARHLSRLPVAKQITILENMDKTHAWNILLAIEAKSEPEFLTILRKMDEQKAREFLLLESLSRRDALSARLGIRLPPIRDRRLRDLD